MYYPHMNFPSYHGFRQVGYGYANNRFNGGYDVLPGAKGYAENVWQGNYGYVKDMLENAGRYSNDMSQGGYKIGYDISQGSYGYDTPQGGGGAAGDLFEGGGYNMSQGAGGYDTSRAGGYADPSPQGGSVYTEPPPQDGSVYIDPPLKGVNGYEDAPSQGVNGYANTQPQSVNYIASPRIKDNGPGPFVAKVEEAAKQNEAFRAAFWTGDKMQLTLMSIEPGEDTGFEADPGFDQFIRIVEGSGIAVMGGQKENLDFHKTVSAGDSLIIPAGKWHNLVNTGKRPLKLYSIYTEPQHPFGTVHATKAETKPAEGGDK